MITYYVVASFSSSVIDLLSFYLINKLINNIIISSYLARIISSIFNYIVNKKYVFKSKSKKSIISYFLLVFINITISGLIVNLLDKYVTIGTTLIKAVIDIIIFVINYYVQKFIIFKS